MGTKNLIMSGLLASLSLFSAANAQLVGTKAIPGDYASLAAAITDLNTLGVGAGGVTFNIAAGYTETFASPTAGLITATGTVNNPVIFKKNGSGANPVITAGVGTTVTNSTAPATVGIDGIIVVAGGDNFTFNGIDLKESDLNVDATTRMEFGYAVLKASETDGAKGINFTNCAVTLNKANTASKGIYVANHLASAATALTIADVAGINTNVKINGCTISNCYIPINIVGYTTATTPVGAFYDTGLEIGTTTGNTLSNYGGSTLAANGMYIGGQNSPTIENNAVTLPAGTTTTSYGINVASSNNGYVKINANTVSVSLSALTSQLCGISVATTIATPVDITNNIVQNCNYVTATTGAFYGIYEQSSTNACVLNINGNTLDGLNYSASTLVGSGAVYPIFTKGNATTNVNNNIIKNYSKNGTGGGNFYGIYSFGSPANENYNNNTIYSLSHAGTGSVVGIYAYTAAGVRVVSGNTIYGLSSNGGAVVGLYQRSSSPDIFKNNIYNLTSTAATGAVFGIYLYDGTAVNIYNNYINDLKAPAATGLNAVMGLNLNGGTTVGAYFNTISLNAVSTSATNFGTSGIYVSSGPTAVELKNNIVVNTSTAVGTGFTVAHRRASAVLTNFAETSNTNLYYAGTLGVNNLIFYDGTNSDQTLAAYKTRMATRDQNAMTENVPFVSATDLHINPSVATQVEGSASVITTPVAITDDFEGTLRSTTSPDIGADEGTFTILDLNGPSITIANLTNTSSLSNRTLSNVVITDPSSVNATAGTKPRLYFRKSPLTLANNTLNDNTSATVGWKFVEANTAVSPFDFTVNYSLLPGGVVAVNDTVQYFVVAQDLATNPNASVASATLATLPTTVALTAANFPATGSIREYAVLGTIAGNFTVGEGQTYPTLTAAINDINSKEINGPILLSLTDAEYIAETWPIVLEANSGSSATNSITIKPAAGVQAVISGTTVASSGIFFLNGADYVTIDGSNTVNGTTKDLFIINNADLASTFTIVFLSPAGDGAKNNTIKNCNIQSGSNSLATVAVLFNNVGGDFDNNTIDNNTITKAKTAIQFVGAAGAITNDGKITNNIIGSTTDANSIGQYGILASYCDNLLVKNNEIMGVAAGSSSIYSQTGVLFGTATTNSVVSNNKIHDFYYSGTGGWGNYGIWLATSATMNNTIANNMIYDIKADGYYDPGYTNIYCPYGILIHDALGTKIYYNSIYMTGATLNYDDAYSAGICITSGSTDLDIRNNIISNSMTLKMASTSTGVKTYGIYAQNPATSFVSINNNAYDITGETPQIGFLAAACPTIGDWQTATGKELNSASGTISFLSPTDLHLSNDPDLNTIIIKKGQAIADVTTDFDGESRNPTQPFIGCDENIALSINTAAIPQHDQLSQNYPNPFNPETIIRFALANEAKINLTVYNAKGEVVQTLVNSSIKAGFHNVKFNALGFNSGVYFYKLTTPEISVTKKMLMVK